MVISDMHIGTCATVVSLDGSERVASTLRQMGFYPGDRVRLLRAAPFGGPLLVEINRREIALGRRVAGMVRVEPGSDS